MLQGVAPVYRFNALKDQGRAPNFGCLFRIFPVTGIIGTAIEDR